EGTKRQEAREDSQAVCYAEQCFDGASSLRAFFVPFAPSWLDESGGGHTWMWVRCVARCGIRRGRCGRSICAICAGLLTWTVRQTTKRMWARSVTSYGGG